MLEKEKQITNENGGTEISRKIMYFNDCSSPFVTGFKITKHPTKFLNYKNYIDTQECSVLLSNTLRTEIYFMCMIASSTCHSSGHTVGPQSAYGTMLVHWKNIRKANAFAYFYSLLTWTPTVCPVPVFISFIYAWALNHLFGYADFPGVVF